MGTRKNIRVPVVDTTKQTVADAIRILVGEKADECIAWAKEHQKLIERPQTPERSEKEANYIIQDWKILSANKEKWLQKLSEIPEPHEEEPLTIGGLHAYLTKLLALHPDISAVPVYHEECCGMTDSWLVEFDAEKDRLCIV